MKMSPIEKALDLPNGARFARVALQVNPHVYANQYRGEQPTLDRDAYNSALAKRCLNLGIGAVGITHHNNVDDIEELAAVLDQAGITVFPGFEIASSEGVHVLCLYDPGTSCATLNRYLGEFGIRDTKSSAQLSSQTFQNILQSVRDHGGIAIAAHATSECGGLLKVLSGQSRINAWKDQNLLAIQIPGAVEDLPDDLRPIVQNKNADYRRPTAPSEQMAIAVLNALDIKGSDDLSSPGATTRIKMASRTIEGLRQAFLDPESRIILNSAKEEVEPDVRIEAVAWGGGFLADQALHLHEGLNVLIGGRGTGKSTVVESLRYAFDLEPLGKEARETHQQIVKSVLGSGSRIWVKVHASKPSSRSYIVERGVGEAPVVRTEEGEITRLRPADILADLQIYGQHEIAELTRDKVRQTALIRRFVVSESNFATRKESLLQALRKNRQSLVQSQAEQARIDEKLSALPGIEETLKSFKDAGLEEKLKHQSLLVREASCLRAVNGRLEPFQEVIASLEESLPIDRAVVSEEALKDLPNKDILGKARDILASLESGAGEALTRLKKVLSYVEEQFSALHNDWEAKKAESNAAYEKTLRELHREKIDGAEFVRSRQRIEELKPLKARREQLGKQFAALLDERRNLLIEWEGVLSEEFRELQKAAKSATRKLPGQVKLEVVHNGDRRPLIDFLEAKMGGRKDQVRRAMEDPGFSLQTFAQAVLDGASQLQGQFAISAAQSEALVQLPLDTRLEFGELVLETTTEVSLNVAAEGQAEEWKKLQDLSKGQKATALLLLLLLDSRSPLVVDQPEDDLDNRFVSAGVVPRIRAAKQQRQFLFATHNANIPVLGDAELIAVLTASGEADGGQGHLKPSEMGAIDTPKVKSLVEELLEGGHSAFEARRKKYRF